MSHDEKTAAHDKRQQFHELMVDYRAAHATRVEDAFLAVVEFLRVNFVAEGFQIVPKVPTPEMLKAAASAAEVDAVGGLSAWPSDTYKAMLAAAPKP